MEHLPLGIIASGAVLHYLDITHHTQISHIVSLKRIEEDHYVRLDKFTVRNLELLAPLNEGGKSLLDVLDKTITPMGSRLLRRWIVFPLKDINPIEKRLDVVENFPSRNSTTCSKNSSPSLAIWKGLFRKLPSDGLLHAKWCS